MISKNRLLEIYRLHKTELFYYIYRMTNHHEASEDIMHDCFENLIKYSEKYHLEDSNLRSFLYKTAHNLTLNYLNREKRVNDAQIDDTLCDEKDKGVGMLIELDELNGAIYNFLQTVDPVSKAVFVMRKESDMGMAEIADNLSISERTVRRKLTVLLEKLAENLKKAGLISIFIFIMSIFP